MSIKKLVVKKCEIEDAIKNLNEEYQVSKRKLQDDLTLANFEISLAKKSIDPDKVKAGFEVLQVRGSHCDTEQRKKVVSDAIDDLSGRMTHLKKQYFGVKVHSGFGEQLSHHAYGCAPKHGSIVFSIGLKDHTKDLWDSQIEDSLYLLLNLPKVLKLKNKEVAHG